MAPMMPLFWAWRTVWTSSIPPRGRRPFAAAHEGKVGALDGAALGAAIVEFERQEERLGRISSYAQLVHAGDLSDPEIGRFSQNVRERVTAVSTKLLFFELELRRIEEDDLEAKLEDPELARYRPWLRDMRAFRPYQLSDEVEKLLHEKTVTGRSAWMRLFDETLADLRFPFRGEELTETGILHLLSDKDGAKRKEAAQSFGRVLGDNIRPFALVTNTIAKD